MDCSQSDINEFLRFISSFILRFCIAVKCKIFLLLQMCKNKTFIFNFNFTAISISILSSLLQQDKMNYIQQKPSQSEESQRSLFLKLLYSYDKQSSSNIDQEGEMGIIMKNQNHETHFQIQEAQNYDLHENTKNQMSNKKMDSQISEEQQTKNQISSLNKSSSKRSKYSWANLNNKRKEPRKKKIIQKQEKKSKAQLKEAQKKKRRQYFTKNFLPAFKHSHLNFIEKMNKTIYESDEGVKEIRKKKGNEINMGDYVYMYKIEGMKKYWEMYFDQKIIYRNFMSESRVAAQNKIVFEKYIYRFEQVFRTGVFDHIAQF